MAAVAYAHSAEHAASAASYLAWDTTLDLPTILLALLLLYILDIVRPRSSRANREAVRAVRRRALGFCAGLMVLYIALASPIDAIGERYLFSVHMLQHVLLVYPVAMLLLWGLPPTWLETWASKPAIAPIMRWLTHPVFAAVTFNVIFTAWHIPGLYEWALRDPLVHRLEHVMILASAWLMWWPILSPLPRRSPGAQVIYVLALAIGQIPVVAYLTFSSEVFYPTYEAAQRLVSLSPLEDQRLGGMVMKLASMGVFVVVLATTFSRWHRDENPPDAYALVNTSQATQIAQ